eukprot:1629521-Pleurochrysis_carterae.AAC.1
MSGTRRAASIAVQRATGPGLSSACMARRLQAHMVVAEQLAPGAGRSGACARACCKPCMLQALVNVAK